MTPTRGDATELVANFQTWNNEGAVGPHEMVAEQHESTVRIALHDSYRSPPETWFSLF